jgi:structural maintenance of chromosomes protein 5
LTQKAQNEYNQLLKKQNDMTENMLKRGLIDENGARRTGPELQSINEELESYQEELDEIKLKVRRHRSEVDELSNDSMSLRRQRESIARQMTGLNDVRNQRMAFLEKNDSHLFQATTWLQQNRDKFRQQVFDPVMLELNMKDPRYAKAIVHLSNDWKL